MKHRNRLRETNVDKKIFLQMMKNARKEVFTKFNINSAWKACELISFNSQRVLDKISKSTRSNTSSISASAVSSTSKIKDEYLSMMNKINSYTRDYELLKSKTKKAVSTLYANRHLLQETNRSLFRANMRKQKEKIVKRNIVRYFIALRRVLTSAQTKNMRKEALHKEELMKKKKKETQIKKQMSSCMNWLIRSSMINNK